MECVCVARSLLAVIFNSSQSKACCESVGVSDWRSSVAKFSGIGVFSCRGGVADEVFEIFAVWEFLGVNGISSGCGGFWREFAVVWGDRCMIIEAPESLQCLREVFVLLKWRNESLSFILVSRWIHVTSSGLCLYGKGNWSF